MDEIIQDHILREKLIINLLLCLVALLMVIKSFRQTFRDDLPGSNVPPAPTIPKMPEVKNMTDYEDECVGCPKEMGCLGNSCPHMNVPHHYCDYCGDELPDGYIEYDGGEYCESCFWKVTGARKVER